MASAGRKLAALSFVLLCAALPAYPATREPTPPSAEIWLGVDATSHAWSVYSGATYAPFGPVSADGWRLRMAGGYGEYHYQGGHHLGSASVHGVVTFADLLAGYQASLGALTIKAFAGATADLHGLDPFDPENDVRGDAIGWKAALEGWLNISPASWAALDLSYGSAHDSFSGRLRLGYRLWPMLSVGLEAGAFGNAESESGRGGALLRYEWAGGEISASAGVSGDIERPANPYATLVWLARY